MQKEITLTPNNRLARHLRSTSLTTWLTNCWHEYAEPQTLLNSHQERLLWQQVIEDVLGKKFSHITNTVIKAHELLINWQLDIANWSNYESEDVVIFKRLSNKFTEYCKKKNLVTTCQLPSLLLPFLQQREIKSDSPRLAAGTKPWGITKGEKRSSPPWASTGIYSPCEVKQLKITFTGFNEYPPQLQMLIDNLQKSNYQIAYRDPNNYKNSSYKKLSFAKQCDEITTIARWAKQLIKHNPKVNIGVVVANLTDLRPEIIRVFNDVLGDTKSINVSAGTIFSSLPMISQALDLLALHEPFDLKTLNKVLLSPYIHGVKIEKSNRALFDFQLHQLNQAQFWLTDIEFLAKKYAKDISILINTLQKTRDIFTQIKSKKLNNSEWIKIFAQILQTLGWPGENNIQQPEGSNASPAQSIKNNFFQHTEMLHQPSLSLAPFARRRAGTSAVCWSQGWGEDNKTNPSSKSEIETKIIERFTELLEEFATTDLIAGKTSYTQALRFLRNMASHTIFQAGHKTDSPINILGTLEAAGINFDYLWIMGLDQESWPEAPHPNPFIPIKIQKKFGLPHSSAERELHFAENLIKRFKRSARKVIFSYVKQNEDRTVEPSALIADIPESCIDDLDLAVFTPRAQEIYNIQQPGGPNASPAQAKLRAICETQAWVDNPTTPPSSKSEIEMGITTSSLINGGSRIIESQSLCPFRAFAEFRLNAKEFKQLELGISKLKRGILIHTALEKFWREVKNHRNLCALDQATLQELIKKCVEYALNKEHLAQILYSLEQKCLIKILNRWLEIEKARPPFAVIATEKTIETTLGPMQIKLRIDRIDKLADGSLLLIDYKTGKKLPVIFDWFGRRPKNPQLPLYCVAVTESQGLAFAQINVESIKFKSITLDELAFGMHSTDETSFKNNISWHELIVYWQEILVNLAKDFASGHAEPQPLSPQVCRQCEFGLLCRYIYNK